MSDTEHITLNEALDVVELNNLSRIETICLTEQAPEQIVFAEVGEKGDKGDKGDVGISQQDIQTAVNTGINAGFSGSVVTTAEAQLDFSNA